MEIFPEAMSLNKTIQVQWLVLQMILKYSFFQNEEIFVQLDELDELNSIIHAWIEFNYSLTQARKTY